MINKEIERKWVWIAIQCIKRGYEEAAKLALEIDNAILTIYGNKHTQEWIKDYENLDEDKSDVILKTAVACGYCIACSESKTCKMCKFAKTCGDCSDSESVYRMFLNVLEYEEEEGKKYDF